MPEQILYIESDLGYWGTVSDHDEITLTVKSRIGNYDTDIDKLLNISSNPYVPQKGDKISFMPGVSIPRVKFKNLALEHGIKTVRNPNDANIFFANISSIHKMTSRLWGYKVASDDFRAMMKDDEVLSKMDEQHIERVNTALEFYTNEFLMVDRPLANYMSSTRDFTTMRSTSRVLVISDEYQDMINAAQGKEIYDEAGIVDQLNGDDASIIDKAMYEQLLTMFESSDTDNHVLAMEIMANCRYNASLVYLLLLFKNASNTMYSCSTKGHVNFKSLMNWLSPNILTRNSIDDITYVLRDKGQLTAENLDIILENCAGDITARGGSNVFKVKTITLDPEYLTEMNLNYSFQIQDEFVPFPVIEEEIPVGEDEIPESEFAVEDNFEIEGPEEEGHIIEEVIEPNMESTAVESVTASSESELNNHQINTEDESSIDWF